MQASAAASSTFQYLPTNLKSIRECRLLIERGVRGRQNQRQVTDYRHVYGNARFGGGSSARRRSAEDLKQHLPRRTQSSR